VTRGLAGWRNPFFFFALAFYLTVKTELRVPPLAVALTRTIVAVATGQVGNSTVSLALPARHVKVAGREDNAEPPLSAAKETTVSLWTACERVT